MLPDQDSSNTTFRCIAYSYVALCLVVANISAAFWTIASGGSTFEAILNGVTFLIILEIDEKCEGMFDVPTPSDLGANQETVVRETKAARDDRVMATRQAARGKMLAAMERNTGVLTFTVTGVLTLIAFVVIFGVRSAL